MNVVGVASHEGERSKPLINLLDLDRKIAKVLLPLDILEKECFK